MREASAPRVIARRAAAKLNLALHVVGQRPDGYHLLDTLVVFADAGDVVSVEPSDRLSLAIEGPLAAHAPTGADNLAWRAALALGGPNPYGAHLRIDKRLPAGAGFGGGSADAAATLLALNELWEAGRDTAALAALGASLGADVPMCVYGGALRARGIGERIEAVAGWPRLPVVLAWPGEGVSTPAIYAALARRDNLGLAELPREPTIIDLAQWLAAQRNDLEEPAIGAAPVIGRVLDAFRATEGCLLARMSGSGSGCFGMYGTPEAAEAAAKRLQAAEPGWWVQAATAQ